MSPSPCTRLRAPYVAALALAWACRPAAPDSSVPPQAPTTGTSPSPALACGPEVRGAAALTGAGSVLLVGEMHGTTEVPALVGRVACHAARSGEAGVVLGLEVTADNQPAFDAYLASDGTDADVAALLGSPHFASEVKDGRSSQGMLQLLVSVRRWRAAGARLEVVCFDAGPGAAETAAARDAVMAQTLLAAHRAHPGATLVTLSGNVHNRTVPGVPWDPAFVPMGAHLRQALPQLVSLDFQSAGGTLWACMGTPDTGPTCGVGRLGGEDRGAEPFVELHAARDEQGFDGVLYVGTATASEPAAIR